MNLRSAEETAEWLGQLGGWAIAASILFNILISISGVLPSAFLSGANAIVFGLPLGFSISLIGEVLGALISYWLYRKGLLVLRRRGARLRKWRERIANAGKVRQFVLILFARVLPFIPSGAVTFFAAWIKMNVLAFMVATLVGKAPSIAAEVWLGYSLFAFFS
ncbi:TVP38/TMEM64 family protein [Paenibacillus chungangensis]|uniref:TVP38/TMEM64 family membrane protein n=1 Tax=Paenibacillus chungangensis TaxID=696535 RepID=A0ABW3HUN7_9BACL